MWSWRRTEPQRRVSGWAGLFAAVAAVGAMPAAGLAQESTGQSGGARGSKGQAGGAEAEVELEETTVYGEAESGDQLVGPYKQPAWTARQQRFPTTRAFVLPPGVVEFEVFSESTFEDDSKPSHEFQQEVKIGLPWRTQLDLYNVQDRPGGGEIRSKSYKIEIRHAFADWGEIPLSPTGYVEYEGQILKEESQSMEYKLLLADTLKPRWHWAGNLIFEHDLENDKIEYGVSSGISYELIRNTFSVGAETELINEDEGSGELPKTEFLIGPSMEYRPTQRTSLRVSPLFGVGHDSPDLALFVVFGIGFGSSEGAEFIGPAGTEMR